MFYVQAPLISDALKPLFELLSVTTDKEMNLKPLNSLVLALVVIAHIVLLSSCSKSSKQSSIKTKSPTAVSTAPSSIDAEKRGNALLRIIGAVPTGASFDLFINGKKEFDKVTYKSVSPYKELVAQTLSLSVKFAELMKDEVVATDEILVDRGIYYTLVLIPNNDGNSLKLALFKDEFDWPSRGHARIRVIHASSEMEDLDLYVGDRSSFVLTVARNSASVYADLKPHKEALGFYPKEKSTSLLTLSGVGLEKSRIYTIVIVGRQRSMPKLDGLIVEDQIQENRV